MSIKDKEKLKEERDEIQKYFDENPISISFDMESISASLAEIQEQFNALELESTITIKEGGVEKFLLNLSDVGANLITIGSAMAVLLPKGIQKNLKELTGGFGEAKEACKDFKVMVGDLAGKFEHFSGMVKSADSNLEKAFKEFKNLGKAMGEGIVSGISSMDNEAKEAMIEVVADIISAAREKAKVNSPSKVFKEIGGYISEGLGEGIKDGAKFATKAMDSLSDNVVDASKSLSKIEDGAKDYSKSLDKVGDATEKVNDKKISFGGAFAIAVTIIGTLVEFFKNLMESNEEFGAKVDEVWGKVAEAFAPVTEAVMGLFDSFTSGSEGMGGSMDVIMEIINSASEMITGVISWISDFFAQNGDAIMAIVSAVWSFIQPIVTLLGELVGDVLTFIMGLFTGNGEEIKEGAQGIWDSIAGILDFALSFVGDIFSQIWQTICDIFSGEGEFFAEMFNAGWEAVKNAFSGCVDFFSNIWSKIKSLFTKIGTAIGSGISGAFKSVVNGVISFASKIINGFISSINKAIKTINNIPGVSIPVLAKISLPKLEMGGLVNPGQLFIAREAGPELVASFGSKTAVMNNNQIVESVAGGVYRANAEQNMLLRGILNELRSANESGKPVNISLQMDKYKLGTAVVKSLNDLKRRNGKLNLRIL